MDVSPTLRRYLVFTEDGSMLKNLIDLIASLYIIFRLEMVLSGYSF